MSTKILASAIKKFLAGAKENKTKNLTKQKDFNGKGKQTVKQLIGQGAGASNIEISDKNIKPFESIARKYGVDFALQKDNTEKPPKHLVFFKARDTDAIMAAFKEFSNKKLSKKIEKPSIIKGLQNMMDKVKNQVLDQTKHKDRGRDL